QFAVGWIVMGIGPELEPHQAVFLSVVLKVEGIGDRAQHSASLLIIVLAALDVFGERGRISKKLAHSLIVFLAQLRGERLPVPEKRARDFSLPGLYDVAIVVVFLVFAMDVVAPVSVIAILLV